MVVPLAHEAELDELVAERGGRADGDDPAGGGRGQGGVPARRASTSGMNLGRAAGAGVPGHLHVHVLPRWTGDTNFMTASPRPACCRSPSPTTLERLRAAWPA